MIRTRKVWALMTLVLAMACVPGVALADADSGLNSMYRMYNPYTGEHIYTADKQERYATTVAGWRYEGVGWVAPEVSNTPVYRVYNPYTGEHHFTTGAQERDELVKIGWVDEGIGWYSDTSGIPVYRQYNPYEPAFNHNYTTGAGERDQLVAYGWNDEGICWYGSATEADEPTIADLLGHALEPIGNTLYVYGGGWNAADMAAGSDGCRIGVSPRWAEFAATQDANYNYENTLYQIHDGLDCTGFIGWTVYNTFEDESYQNDGYVIHTTRMTQTYAEYGWGTYTPASQVSDWRAGDVMCMVDHAWLVIGTCSDGSVLFVHASPPAVRLCGTLNSDGSKSEAVRLAEKYMSEQYPEWYAKYPKCYVGSHYLRQSARFRWSDNILPDPDGLTTTSADDVIAFLYQD